MEHTKHLWRAILIILVVVIGGVVWRHFMIPESFGQEGHYRYDSLLEFTEKSPVHGTSEACGTCHAETKKVHDGDKHVSVACETCHAPLASHVRGGERIAPMRMDRSYRLCLLCHRKLVARPADFPQVALKEHLAGLGLPGEVPDKVCKVCHDPHKPAKK